MIRQHIRGAVAGSAVTLLIVLLVPDRNRSEPVACAGSAVALGTREVRASNDIERCAPRLPDEASSDEPSGDDPSADQPWDSDSDDEVASPRVGTAKQALRCELTFLRPSWGGREPPLSESGAPVLSVEQLAEYERIMSREEAGYRDQLNRLYEQVAGKPATIDIEMLESKIENLVDREERERVTQLVAHENAGIGSPGDDDSTYARLLRLETSAADRIEHELQKALGSKLTQQIRETFGTEFVNCDGDSVAHAEVEEDLVEAPRNRTMHSTTAE